MQEQLVVFLLRFTVVVLFLFLINNFILHNVRILLLPNKRTFGFMHYVIYILSMCLNKFTTSCKDDICKCSKRQIWFTNHMDCRKSSQLCDEDKSTLFFLLCGDISKER